MTVVVPLQSFKRDVIGRPGRGSYLGGLDLLDDLSGAVSLVVLSNVHNVVGSDERHGKIRNKLHG